MNKREFNKTLKSLSYDKEGILSAEKIAMADNELKNKLINYLVRNRLPILKNLINNTTDFSWLASMGYMEHKKGKKFDFLCTCENQKLIN